MALCLRNRATQPSISILVQVVLLKTMAAIQALEMALLIWLRLVAVVAVEVIRTKMEITVLLQIIILRHIVLVETVEALTLIFKTYLEVAELAE